MVSGETKTPASQKAGACAQIKKTIGRPASPIRTVPSVPDSDRFGGAFAPFADLSAFPLAGCRFTAGVEFHHPLKQGHYSAAETPCQSPRREIPRFRLPANPLGVRGTQPPEAWFGSGGMYAEAAKALAEQGFLCKGGWLRHRRKLPLRNPRKSGVPLFRQPKAWEICASKPGPGLV